MEAFSWTSLHQQPDGKFLEEWDLWGKHKQSVLSKLTEIRKKAATGDTDDAAAEADLPKEDMDAAYEDDDFYMFPFDDDVFQWRAHVVLVSGFLTLSLLTRSLPNLVRFNATKFHDNYCDIEIKAIEGSLEHFSEIFLFYSYLRVYTNFLDR